MTLDEAIREAQRQFRRHFSRFYDEIPCDHCGKPLLWSEAAAPLFRPPGFASANYAIPGMYHPECCGAVLRGFSIAVDSLYWAPSRGPR